MSFQKHKTNSFCVDGRHRSGSLNSYGDITSKVSKVLTASCTICKKEKYMTFSDNTITVEGLGDFFKNLGENGLNASKRWQNLF